MLREIKEIEEKKIRECKYCLAQIERLEREIKQLTSGTRLPAKKYNFFEKYLTKRKEYKMFQKHRKKEEQENEKAAKLRGKEIEALKQKIKKEIMRRFGVFVATEYFFDSELERIQKAEKFQELGYSSEEEVRKCLEENGIPINFDSIEEGFQMFPETACRNVDFMLNAVNCDLANIRYDKTDNIAVYKLYVAKKIWDLERQQINNPDINNRYEINILKEYYEEIVSPRKVDEGKYKIPHKFMYEELRNAEQPKRDNTGYACTDKYAYLSADGKFPHEYGVMLEEIYTRPDIIFGIHGTQLTDVRGFLENGIRESTNYDRGRQTNNTVSYGEYISFPSALAYGKAFGAKTNFILGLPKNSFSKNNPAHIWGSDEKKGPFFILPEHIIGHYSVGGTIVKNNGEHKRHNYRYRFQDATIDPECSNCIDMEQVQTDRSGM